MEAPATHAVPGRRGWGPRLAGATVLALIVVSIGSVPAVATTAHHTYLAGGRTSAGAVYRPRHVVLSGDSTLWLTRAHWRHWGHLRGRGHALTHWNNCKPNCASGTITVKPANLVLRRARHRCGHWFFTRVRFHFTAGRPPHVRQDYVWNATPTCR